MLLINFWPKMSLLNNSHTWLPCQKQALSQYKGLEGRDLIQQLCERFLHNLFLHHHSSRHLPLSQLCSIIVWGPNSNRSSSISPYHWPVGQYQWGAFRSPSVHASAPSCNCTLDPSHEVWFLLLTWSNCIKPYIIARLMNIFTTVAAKFFLLIEYIYY